MSAGGDERVVKVDAESVSTLGGGELFEGQPCLRRFDPSLRTPQPAQSYTRVVFPIVENSVDNYPLTRHEIAHTRAASCHVNVYPRRP